MQHIIRDYSRCIKLYEEILKRACVVCSTDLPDDIREFLTVNTQSLRADTCCVFLMSCAHLSERPLPVILRMYNVSMRDTATISTRWRGYLKRHPHLQEQVDEVCEMIYNSYCTR